jgi:menaquinone-dependent protoporphyrinogen oxidase
MSRILLLYSSVFGMSRQVCERLATLLAAGGERATVMALVDPAVDLTTYDAIVIGASIRYGKHHPTVLEFIRRHQAVLEARPSALFSVNLVARKADRNTPQTNPYLQALLRQSPWKPQLLGVFAGELNYARYGLFDRQMVRFIMWLTGGPTDLTTNTQFTDWAEVERFAALITAIALPTAPGVAASPAAPVASIRLAA